MAGDGRRTHPGTNLGPLPPESERSRPQIALSGDMRPTGVTLEIGEKRRVWATTKDRTHRARRYQGRPRYMRAEPGEVS